uniref:Uncharacterized protein n=2 Tax=Drosophila melanogaster TaxID=7227 RepID=Q9VW38_DROME|nr:uncharacterized protein Dmel_CG14102 [Drosophila melanogaster]AAF49114.2 uncharacterized protein Dmel_CG14102 [Drosophila melanogaster]|eukprot:NP_649147.2 uncharacterized protein Dmel_CG14102 [Drosophila melanogaster]
MDKLGLGCPFSFLVGRPQSMSGGPGFLDLNYDCYHQIFSYINVLEDQLNLGRAHPLFQVVLTDILRTRHKKINVRLLKTIPDWEFLLQLCGSEVSRCEVPHGSWDEPFTYPFLGLLGRHCPKLRQAVIIFMHAVTESPPKSGDRGHIMQLLLELPSLTNLTLIDARSAQLDQLRHFSKLEALDLDGIDPNLSNASFQQMFESMASLKRLLLNFGPDRRRSHQVPLLADKFPNLDHLTLENFDMSFPELGEFKGLRSLRLISRWTAEVDNDFYRSVAKRVSNLQKLQLISVRVRGDQVHHILAIRQLNALDCDNWPAQSVSQLGQLKDLECLALDCIDSPANPSRQLMLLVQNCYNLNHLRLGKHWKMPIEDVNQFLDNVADAGADRKDRLLLTLDFIKTPDTRKKFTDKFRNDKHLQVSFDGATCHHCQRDTYSKCDTIFD